MTAQRRIAVGALALVGCVALAAAASAACHGQYAVYLSPGYQKGVRWGGYHVTLTGFSANNCGGGKEAVLRNAWRKAHGAEPYSFHSKVSGKDYWAKELQHPWGRRWGVSFKSNVLTHKLKPLLRKGGFDNLKSRWHISLYSESAKAALAKFDSRLKNAPWRLYLVPLPGKACQNDGKGCVNDWIEIR